MDTIVYEVSPNEAGTRAEARSTAEQRARDLSTETGRDHKVRWDQDAQRYQVRRMPFVQPERPWDDGDNQPERRSPDWDRTPTRFAPLGNFLVEAAGLRGYQWLSATDTAPDPAGFVRHLQAALDLQYGRGHFWATRHGHRISVQCRHPVGEA